MSFQVNAFQNDAFQTVTVDTHDGFWSLDESGKRQDEEYRKRKARLRNHIIEAIEEIEPSPVETPQVIAAELLEPYEDRSGFSEAEYQRLMSILMEKVNEVEKQMMLAMEEDDDDVVLLLH